MPSEEEETCGICGEVIRVMCQKNTGVCGEHCRKVRDKELPPD